MRRKKVSVSRTIALLLAFALVFTGIMPAGRVQAANWVKYTNAYGKAGMTGRNAAMTDLLGSKSYKYVYLKNKTGRTTYSLPRKDYGTKRLRVNAPESDFINKATLKIIKIDALKNTWREYGKGNNILVDDPTINMAVSTNASVNKLYFRADNGTAKLNVYGTVNKLGFYGDDMDVKVKLDETSDVKRIQVSSPMNLVVSGGAENVVVNVSEKAAGTKIQSSVPVAVTTAAKIELSLKAGAEGSSVTKATAEVDLTVQNETTETVVITAKDSGEKQEVASGESVSPETEDKGETEETEKPEEGGNTGNNSGGSTGGGGWYPPSEPETAGEIVLDQSEVELSLEEKPTMPLTIKSLPSGCNTSEVVWSSSDTKVAAVEGGLVTALSNGEAWITAAVKGKSTSCHVVVTTREDKLLKAIEQGGVVTVTEDIANDLYAYYPGEGTLEIDFGDHVMAGSFSLTAPNAGQIILKDKGTGAEGAVIAGNLILNAPKAHVEQSVAVKGTVEVLEVAASTLKVNDETGKVEMKGAGKLELSEDLTEQPEVAISTTRNVTLAGKVGEVTVTSPYTEVTVADRTTVEKVTVASTETLAEDSVKLTGTGTGTGTIQQVEAKTSVAVQVPVTELIADAPVVLAEKVKVGNVKINSNTAAVTVATGASIQTVAVPSNVKTVKLKGKGQVETVDLTAHNEQPTITSETTEMMAETSFATKNAENVTYIANNQSATKKSKTVTDIKLNVQGEVKTEYLVGENLQIKDMTVTVTYSEGPTKTVPVTKSMVKGFDNKYTAASQNVTIVCEGKEVPYSEKLVTVKENAIQEIRVKNLPVKLKYKKGETLNPKGLNLLGVWANGKSNALPYTPNTPNGKEPAFTFGTDPANLLETLVLSEAGTITVYVGYAGQTTSFEVTVEEAGYTVAFVYPGETEIVTVAAGEKVARPAADPQMPELFFGGWHESEPDGAMNGAYDFNQPVNRNIVLHTHWFDDRGSEAANELQRSLLETVNGGTLLLDQKITLEGNINLFVPRGVTWKFTETGKFITTQRNNDGFHIQILGALDAGAGEKFEFTNQNEGGGYNYIIEAGGKLTEGDVTYVNKSTYFNDWSGKQQYNGVYYNHNVDGFFYYNVEGILDIQSAKGFQPEQKNINQVLGEIQVNGQKVWPGTLQTILNEAAVGDTVVLNWKEEIPKDGRFDVPSGKTLKIVEGGQLVFDGGNEFIVSGTLDTRAVKEPFVFTEIEERSSYLELAGLRYGLERAKWIAADATYTNMSYQVFVTYSPNGDGWWGDGWWVNGLLDISGVPDTYVPDMEKFKVQRGGLSVNGKPVQVESVNLDELRAELNKAQQAVDPADKTVLWDKECVIGSNEKLFIPEGVTLTLGRTAKLTFAYGTTMNVFGVFNTRNCNLIDQLFLPTANEQGYFFLQPQAEWRRADAVYRNETVNDGKDQALITYEQMPWGGDSSWFILGCVLNIVTEEGADVPYIDPDMFFIGENVPGAEVRLNGVKVLPK